MDWNLLLSFLMCLTPIISLIFLIVILVEKDLKKKYFVIYGDKKKSRLMTKFTATKYAKIFGGKVCKEIEAYKKGE